MTARKEGPRKAWTRTKAKTIKAWAIVNEHNHFLLLWIGRSRLELVPHLANGDRIARVKIEETLI